GTMPAGRLGATVVAPGSAAGNVFMKKLSPPSIERFRPPRNPPLAWVSIVSEGDMLTIAPDSANTLYHACSRMMASEYDGLYWISDSTRIPLRPEAGESTTAR